MSNNEFGHPTSRQTYNMYTPSNNQHNLDTPHAAHLTWSWRLTQQFPKRSHIGCPACAHRLPRVFTSAAPRMPRKRTSAAPRVHMDPRGQKSGHLQFVNWGGPIRLT
eukprot:2113293-Pyramimonas_sp.AAC.2